MKHCLRIQRIDLRGRPMQNAILLQHPILFFTQQQRSVMEKCYIVAELFQITDNVGGNQDGMLRVSGKIRKQLQHFSLEPTGQGRRWVHPV